MNKQLELIEQAKRQYGLSDYDAKRLAEKFIEAQIVRVADPAEIEIRKYEVDKKVELGIYTKEQEDKRLLRAHVIDKLNIFIKDGKLTRVGLAVIIAIASLISQKMLYTYLTERLYVENNMVTKR